MADIMGADLAGLDLAGLDLVGGDLAGLDLAGDLSGADLSGTDLAGLDLAGDLSGADLAGLDLAGLDLAGDLSGADLSGADLAGLDLSGAAPSQRARLARAMRGALQQGMQRGAAALLRRIMVARQQRAAGQRLPGGSAGVRPTTWNTERRLVAPLGDATSVAAGGSETLTITPQRPIRIERLVLEGHGLYVTGIKVGVDDIFCNVGSIPIETFDYAAVDTSMRGFTAGPGITVTVTVTNPTVAAVTVVGCIIGTALTG
jgi:hypothetical protein